MTLALEPDKDAATDLAGKTVMVVEDEMFLALDVVTILEKLGCVVSGPFTTLADGLAAATDLSCDCAILDMNLRGEQCFPIAEVLAQRAIPFAFATGYDQVAYHRDAPKIDKPYRAPEIEAILVKLLG